MRTFSDFEKEILRFMVYHPEPQDMCTIALFEKYSDCYLIRWSDDFCKLTLVYDEGKNFMDIRRKVFDIVILIDYLKTNYYIGVFPSNMLKGNQIFNNKKYEIRETDEKNINIWRLDECTIKSNHPLLKDFGTCQKKYLIQTEILYEKTTIGRQIQQYANATYHVTQTLKDLVDNNFQTADDIKFHKTYQQAKIGIIIAIIIGAVSMVVTICCTVFSIVIKL